MAKSSESILKEAKSRFKRVSEWESTARSNYRYDKRFAEADSSNMYQWNEDDQGKDKICITINKTMQHCLQIINDQRQNQSQIEIRPIGDGATYKAAEIREGLVRHIENNSNAQAAYENAYYSMVVGGIGWWRVTTDYCYDGTFDQDIYIKRIADAMSVYLDPDIAEFDGSDARYGFVTRDMSREEYEEEYGDFDNIDNTSSPLGEGESDGWEDEDHVRICEYYRKVMKPDKLHLLDNGIILKESDAKAMEKGVQDRQQGDETHLDTLKRLSVQSREISEPKIEWYLIAGSKVIDKKEWAGSYIPLVRCVGTESVTDKVLDRKGHTRSLLDPQRVYNMWTSSAIKQVAMIGKTPYVGPAEAIQGYETYWATANLEEKAILPYNAYTEDGQPLEAPQRVVPPQMAPAYLDGLKIAQQEMMMASGQYEANLGQKSNEVSGKAVQERQRQGENSTYHFIAHFSQAIRFTGRILNELMPLIYDTEREMQILNPDGSQTKIKVNPNLKQAHQQVQDPDDEDNFNREEIVAAMNPNMGRYAVECDIGPAYATKRQEATNAFMQMIQIKEIAPFIADLAAKNMDFPGADEMAKRLKNMVPKQALGQNAPDPQVQQMQQQMAQQHQIMMKGQDDVRDLQQKLAVAQMKAAQHDPNLDWYNAETQRFAAAGKIDPVALMPVVKELVSQILGQPVNQIIAQHAAEAEAMPGSDTQLANQQHAQQMAQMQAQQAHEAQMQGAQQAQQIGMQQADQSHAADMQSNQQEAAAQAQADAAKQNQGNNNATQ